MIETAVQLVQHPGRVGLFGDQHMSPVNQIGEIERAPRRLLPLVKTDVGAGEGEGVDGVLRDLRGDELTADVAQAFLLILQPGANGRIDRLGAEPGGRGAGACGDHAPEFGEGGPIAKRAHPVGELAVRLARSPRHQFGPTSPLAPPHAAQGFRLDVNLTGDLGKTAATPDIRDIAVVGFRRVDVGGNGGAAGLEVGEHGVERGPVELHREVRVGGGDHALRRLERQLRHLLPRQGGYPPRRVVFQDGEARRDASLEREPPKELFAEGVDGLDLQPARCLQGAGEKRAGGGAIAPRLLETRQGFV